MRLELCFMPKRKRKKSGGRRRRNWFGILQAVMYYARERNRERWEAQQP